MTDCFRQFWSQRMTVFWLFLHYQSSGRWNNYTIVSEIEKAFIWVPTSLQSNEKLKTKVHFRYIQTFNSGVIWSPNYLTFWDNALFELQIYLENSEKNTWDCPFKSGEQLKFFLRSAFAEDHI